MYKPVSVTTTLEDRKIIASAPHRLEFGGTWDLKAFALAYEWIVPRTVNIAISLRTQVEIFPYTPGKIAIENGTRVSEFSLLKADFTHPDRLLYIIAAHYGFDGYRIKISYQAPPKAGLGGSGTVSLAVIAALEHVSQLVKNSKPKLDKPKLVYLAHSIEDGMRISLSGLQDQCAAAYGGVNEWSWQFSQTTKFTKERLINRNLTKNLHDHIVVAYIEEHNSNEVNSQSLDSFLNPKTRDDWFTFNENTHKFAKALSNLEFDKLVELLNWENAFRQSMTVNRITPQGMELWSIAKKLGAGFSVCGAGGGGCVWAITHTPEEKVQLETAFSKIVGKDNLIQVQIDNSGLRITETSNEH